MATISHVLTWPREGTHVSCVVSEWRFPLWRLTRVAMFEPERSLRPCLRAPLRRVRASARSFGTQLILQQR